MRNCKLINLIASIFSLVLICTSFSIAQVTYTANDIVKPYQGKFHFGVNPGAYQTDIYQNGGPIPWTDIELADIAVGDPSQNLPGAGVQTFRPSLPGWFVEQFGYGIRDDAFDHYEAIGMTDLTLFLNHPSVAHTDPAIHCPDIQPTVFANLYQPIWDNGENGTPYNDDNYYAAYVYKIVERYGDHIKFYEVWNEPDFSSTSNAQSPPGTPDSWWDKDPDPCDLLWFNAPVQYYVRMLRITYDIVKTLDPDAYVCVGGLGYPSFLDAVMRNTDNPNGGTVNSNYPLKGGAYFDVCSFHYYPHVSNAFRTWTQDITDWTYFRHTDAGIDAFQERFELFKGVVHKYGYDGTTYPTKEYICTETNMPRKEFEYRFGGEQIQVNYAIKLAVFCNQQKIRHLHLFHLGETRNCDQLWSAPDLFYFMGLFKNLEGTNITNVERTNLGIGYKSASDIMDGYWYDAGHTASLNLSPSIRGGAFKNSDGDFLYVLWAKTHTDKSENSQALYSFPNSVSWTSNASATLTKKEWDHNVTQQTTTIGHQNIALTGTPIFLSISPDVSDCNGLSLNINSNGVSCSGFNNGSASVFPVNGTAPYTYNWSTGQSASLIDGLSSGLYTVTVVDSKGCEIIQSININEPFSLNLTVSPTNESMANTNDGSVTAFAGGGTPPYTYTWSNGVFGPYVGNLSPGNYSITLSDANDCQVERTIVIEPGASQGCGDFNISINQQNVSCFGLPDGSLTINPLNGTAPYQFSWNTGQNTANLQFLPAGIYSITVSDADDCQIERDITISQPSQLDIFLNGTNLTGANSNDGSIISIPTGGVPPYNIMWNNGSANFTLENLASGLYTVTLTDANGCSIVDDIIIDTPFEGCENFKTDITIVNNSCFGQNNGFVAANPTGGVTPYSYTWSTGENTASINNLPVGNYKLTIVDAVDCQIERAFNITSPNIISIFFNVSNATDDVSSDGNVSVNVTGGTVPYTYLWSNGNTNSYINNLNPGFYTVTVTDLNGCSTSEEVHIDSEKDDCEDFYVVASILNASCAGGNDGVIVLIPQQGQAPFEYLWSSGETRPDLTNLNAGTYHATITDANNCVFHARETIIEPTSISINFETTITGTCSDEAYIKALVSGGTPPYEYFWSNGSQEMEIFNATTGTYGLTIFDAKGCRYDGEIILQLENLQLQLLSNVQNVSCYGYEDGFIDIAVNNGTPPFTYLWSNGATTEDIFDLSSDSYFVTVVDAEECSSIYNYAVNSPAELEINFNITPPQTNGSPTGSISTEVMGGTPPYQYLWNFGVQIPEVTNLLPGEYQITVTDANDCIKVDTVEIELATSINQIETSYKIDVFPNPGKGICTLLIDAPVNPVSYSVMDINGNVLSKEILSLSQKLQASLNLESFASGAYIIRVQFEDGNSQNLRYVLLP